MKGTQAGPPSPVSDGCQGEDGWDDPLAEFGNLFNDDGRQGPWETTVLPPSPPLSPMRKRKLRRLSDDLFPPAGDKKAHTQQRNEPALFEEDREDRGSYGRGKKTSTVPGSYKARLARREERAARWETYYQRSCKRQMHKLYSNQMRDGLKVVVPPKIMPNGMIQPARILVERDHGQGDSHKQRARLWRGGQSEKRLPQCRWMWGPLPEAGTVAEAAALVRAWEEDGELGTGPVVLVGTDPEGRHFALVAPAEDEA